MTPFHHSNTTRYSIPPGQRQRRALWNCVIAAVKAPRRRRPVARSAATRRARSSGVSRGWWVAGGMGHLAGDPSDLRLATGGWRDGRSLYPLTTPTESEVSQEGSERKPRNQP